MTTRARRIINPGQARTIVAKSGEDAEALVNLIQTCIASGVQRRALLLRLSMLPEDQIGPQQLRLIRQALAPLIMADHGRLFEPESADMAVVWRGEATDALQTSLEAIDRMFEHRMHRAADLTQVLNLPRDAEILLQSAQRRAGPAVRAPATQLPPISPSELAALERALTQADVARFVRRRSVWHVAHDGTGTLNWEERYLSVAEIGASLTPSRDPRGDPWLFRRLTRMLDRRMLALLNQSGELRSAGPFALNLNVSSILSTEFLRFDGNMPAALRGRVLLELSPPDILSDLSSFVFARDFAHARGYRCGLDDPSAPVMQAIQLDALGLDLRRLHWTADVARLEAGALAALASDPSRIVLYGADGGDALSWGIARGIRLFQGRAVENRYV